MRGSYGSGQLSGTRLPCVFPLAVTLGIALLGRTVLTFRITARKRNQMYYYSIVVELT